MSNNQDKFNVDQLLNQIGKRTTPSKQQSAASKAAVRENWQKNVMKHKKQRQQKYLWAMAASIMLLTTVAFVNFVQQPTTTPTEPQALVLDFSGDIQIKSANHSWQWLKSPIDISTNTQIKTSEGAYLTLQLQDQSELRIADNTELNFSSKVIDLNSGQLYHDTDESLQASPLTIKTPYGEVQHVGTRYLVSNTQNQLQVAVRSGQVKITPHQFASQNTVNNKQLISQNQMITINNQGEAHLSPISLHAPLWDWTFLAQEAFDLNDKSLYEFVQWYAHQTGMEIDWQNLESPSKRVRLQGNIKNMTAEKALQTVFYSTQYSYSIDKGVLHISQQ